jgi:hypothetical protein
MNDSFLIFSGVEIRTYEIIKKYIAIEYPV